MKGTLSLLGDYRDEHLLHRLEAFSDIVIGFCLAQLAFSQRGTSLTVGGISAANLYGFALTFALIAALWWLHNRLFAEFFVINSVTIVANFLTLGFLMLMIYLFETMMAAAREPGASDAAVLQLLRWWFLCTAAVYGLIAFMYGIGLSKRWNSVSRSDLRSGIKSASSAAFATVTFAAVGLLLPNLHERFVLIFMACFFALIIIVRRATNRLVPDESAAA